MKEITRVHLASTPYSIELDAKKELENYLAAIEKNMKTDPEALREIEMRMVELLAEGGVSEDGVITHDNVTRLREQMGEPKEFLADGEAEVADIQADDTDTPSERAPRRLMRDTDRAVFGGVCSGLAAYFKVDSVPIRLAALTLIIVSAGSALVIYLLAWLLIPAARTAADRLQMRGEPVTLDALQAYAVGDESRVVRVSPGAKFVRIFLGIMALMVAFGSLIATVVGLVTGISVVGALSGFMAQPWAWGLLASLVIGGVALVVLMGLLSHSAFTWQIRRVSGLVILASLIIGALSISGTALFGTQTANEMVRDERRPTKVVPIELPADAKDAKYFRSTESVVYDGARTGELRAELRYHVLAHDEAPKVTVTRDGDYLDFKIDKYEIEECLSTFITGWNYCFNTPPQIMLYGPIAPEPYTGGEVYSDEEGFGLEMGDSEPRVDVQ